MRRRRPQQRRADERGELVQVAQGRWRQLNVLHLRAGACRGGHLHVRTEELFYVVSGRVRLEVRDGRTGRLSREDIMAGWCFAVRPGEEHRVWALQASVLAVLLSREYDPHRPDIAASGPQDGSPTGLKKGELSEA